MTSRSSCLDLTLIRENFKRFWPIMAGGFLFWIVCGPFALALGGRPYSYGMMSTILRHINPAPIMLNIILPVALAVAVFSYLHRTNSAGVMHAMPYSRKSLFVSNYVSGLVMALLPVLVITLILLAMNTGVKPEYYMDQSSVFTFADFARFFLEEFTIITFVYSISVFAASISGLSVIHTLTAAALNFIVPVVYLILMGYMDIFEYGFNAGTLLEEVALRMNPYIRILDDGLSAKEVVIYLAIALVITVLAYLLYKARHLERAGESYVFRPAKYIIGFLMVFVCSSLTGFVFYGQLGVGAFIPGFVVGYVVSQMIVNKSTKIFTKECLTSGLVYALVIAACICVFRFDLVGYQKRVPDASRVEKVTIQSNVFDMGLDGLPDTISEPENIAKVTEFHRLIVSDPENYQNLWLGNYTSMNYSYDSRDYEDPLTRPVSFNIEYTMKNGLPISRNYTIPAIMLMKDAGMREVWNSAENGGLYDLLLNIGAVNTDFTLEGYNLTNGSQGEFTNWESYEQDNMPMGTSRLAEKEALLKAIREDVRTYDYDRLFDDKDYAPYINIHLDCRESCDPSAPEKYDNGTVWTYYDYNDAGQPIYRHTVMDVNVNKSYVHTLEALQNMDLSDDLMKAVEIVLK
jgi:ABC-2 type transport system permease protein